MSSTWAGARSGEASGAVENEAVGRKSLSDANWVVHGVPRAHGRALRTFHLFSESRRCVVGGRRSVLKRVNVKREAEHVTSWAARVQSLGLPISTSNLRKFAILSVWRGIDEREKVYKRRIANVWPLPNSSLLALRPRLLGNRNG